MKDYTLSKENIAELENFIVPCVINVMHLGLCRRSALGGPFVIVVVDVVGVGNGGLAFFLVFLAVWVNFGLGLTI
jgi:hypothetical protein